MKFAGSTMCRHWQGGARSKATRAAQWHFSAGQNAPDRHNSLQPVYHLPPTRVGHDANDPIVASSRRHCSTTIEGCCDRRIHCNDQGLAGGHIEARRIGKPGAPPATLDGDQARERVIRSRESLRFPVS